MQSKEGLRQIIFISNSIIPNANAGGGSIILYRHLKRLEEEGFKILVIHCIPGKFTKSGFEEIYLPKKIWYPPLRKITPFFTQLRNLLYSYQLGAIPNIENSRILALFGDYTNLLAVLLAKKHKIPLYMIVHDDNIFNAYGSINVLSKKHIKKIIPNTRHFFAVSKPMKQLLDANQVSSSSLLYPIPEGCVASSRKLSPNPSKTYYNTGLLFEDLHLELIQNLAECMKKTNSKFVNVGHLSKSFEEKLSDFNHLRIVDRFEKTSDLLAHLIENADVLFVFYSFKVDLEHRMHTSFPSKLAEYSHLGKPIFIIAPQVSSLGKWALENNWLSYLDNDDPEQIMAMMERFDDEVFCNKCIQQSYLVSKGQFDPASIHIQFRDTLLNERL